MQLAMQQHSIESWEAMEGIGSGVERWEAIRRHM